MKTLRLDLYQETACYKKPMAFKVGETYPLPPYSTVKGMLHALVDADQFIPMRLSVQGSYETLITDYQTHYFFKKLDANEFPIILDGLVKPYEWDEKIMTKMPLYVHLLYGVKLVIHVQSERDVIKNMVHAIETGKAIGLGRWEDLVRVDAYETVELEEREEGRNRFPAYVPVEYLDEADNYVPYRLNWKYSIVHGTRKWEKIEVGYIQQGIDFEDGCLCDEHGDIVFFHQ